MKTRLLAFFIFLSIQLCAQSVPNQVTYRVVALDGLNIRNAPSKNAPIIGGIPFLEEVRILDHIDASTKDTIGSKIIYAPICEVCEFPLIGSWVKIKYAQTEGYVFNAYLANIPAQQINQIEGTNTEYGINFAGQDCFDNFHRNKNLQWYGMYPSKKEGQFIVQAIDIEYSTVPNEYIGSTVSGGKKGLLLMLGFSKDKKINKQVKGEFFHPFSKAFYRQFPFDEEPLKQYAELTHTYDKVDDYYYVGLQHEHTSQILNPKHYQFSSIRGVVWKGDLDGDHKDDYIIRYGEKALYIVLYISSEAKKGDIVRPVAVYYSGYCC